MPLGERGEDLMNCEALQNNKRILRQFPSHEGGLLVYSALKCPNNGGTIPV